MKGILQGIFSRAGPAYLMTQPEAEALFDKGWNLIRAGRLTSARKIAKQLLKARFTGGFELLAMVQNSAGQHDKAIQTLRDGLDTKPVWRLANLLGNYLSDAGRYHEALDAYDRSSGMHGDDPDATHLNCAIVLSRAGRDREARQMLRDLLDRDLEADLAIKVRAVASDLGITFQ